jgi:hypothetical protein
MSTKKIPLTERQMQHLMYAQTKFNEAQEFVKQSQAELSRIIDLVLDAHSLPESTQIETLNVDQQCLEVVVSDTESK